MDSITLNPDFWVSTFAEYLEGKNTSAVGRLLRKDPMKSLQEFSNPNLSVQWAIVSSHPLWTHMYFKPDTIQNLYQLYCKSVAVPVLQLRLLN